MTRLLCLLAALTTLLAVTPARADSVTDRLAPIQKQWAVIKYETPDKGKQVEGIRKLVAQAAELEQAAPARAEPKIWHAITLATEASFNRGLSSLPLVKQAKAQLEAAIKIDGNALDGLAYTYLGSLYDQVPGWPIAFGDSDKANAMFKKALEISPKNIDANYFYGQYLLGKGKDDAALAVLKTGLAAPDRAGRKLADEGRRAELRDLIAQAELKAAKAPVNTLNK